MAPQHLGQHRVQHDHVVFAALLLAGLDLGDLAARGQRQLAPRQLGEFADAQARVGQRQVDPARAT